MFEHSCPELDKALNKGALVSLVQLTQHQLGLLNRLDDLTLVANDIVKCSDAIILLIRTLKICKLSLGLLSLDLKIAKIAFFVFDSLKELHVVK